MRRVFRLDSESSLYVCSTLSPAVADAAAAAAAAPALTVVVTVAAAAAAAVAMPGDWLHHQNASNKVVRC